jgi:hypothetical protein
MKIDNDFLRKLFQGYVSSRRPKDRKNCPSSSTLASSFEPSASLREKKRIIDHISECSLCKEELMLLFEFQGYNFLSGQEVDEALSPILRTDSDRSKSHEILSLRRYAYVLFGIGFIISAIFLIVQQKQFSAIQRNRDTGIVLLYPTSAHILPGTLIFRWQKQPLTQYYILELFDEALLPIWTSDEIEDTQLLLPDDVSSKLQIGKSYFWMVTSFSDMSKKEESKLARFLILNKK